MPQAFPLITPTTKLQDSLDPILQRDLAAKSCFEGTVFPSVDLLLGHLCFRSDLGKLYVCTGLTPIVTWEPFLTNALADARYLRLAGNQTVTGQIVFSGLTTQQDGNTYAGTHGRYSAGYPGGIHLYSDITGGGNHPTFAEWQFANTPRMRLTNAGVLTVNGQLVWNAGNDGVGSGLDADLLDGQNGSFYQNFNNLTNVPGFGDAAFNSVAGIRAGVDVSSRVAKSGDVMQGNLIINNGSPTIYFQNNAARAGAIHIAGSQMYFIRTSGVNSTAFEPYAGAWPLVLNLENNEASFGGNIYTRTYGWLHDRFAQRNPALGQGGTRVTSNCGDTFAASGYELFDAANGRHQVRMYGYYGNCNCDCSNCGTGGGTGGE